METGIVEGNLGDLRMRLQATFARLTSKQQEWLLTRRYYNTDTECSKELGYGDRAPQANWKRASGDFRDAFSLILSGVLEGADEIIIEALSNANGLRALIEERKIIDMSWGDASESRLGSTKGAAMKAAVDRVKPSKHITEHVFTVGEVKEVLDATAKSVE